MEGNHRTAAGLDHVGGEDVQASLEYEDHGGDLGGLDAENHLVDGGCQCSGVTAKVDDRKLKCDRK